MFILPSEETLSTGPPRIGRHRQIIDIVIE
eukprot:COSAG06_NODE_52001_length_308_cov_1.229665_1_plen_29_part_01